MSPRYRLQVRAELSNIGDGKDPADHPYDDDADQRPLRDVHLWITDGRGQPLSFLLTLPREGYLSHTANPSKLTEDQVNHYVQNCRHIWQTMLRDVETTHSSKMGQRNVRPFCEAVNMKNYSAQWVHKWMGRLAVAGNQMFHCLFRSCEDDLHLKQIGDKLESLSRKRALYITVQSDVCSIPWWMIYIHPAADDEFDRLHGTNYKPEGFWGYRHVIEQIPAQNILNPKLSPAYSGKICGSINYDQNIDVEFQRLGIKCIKQHLKDISRLRRWTRPIRRRTKQDFRTAISGSNFRDEVIYFFCHGEGASDPGQRDTVIANLRLTDQEPIFAQDISFWRQTPFNPTPIVFINACQGGQVTPFFYDALVPVFLQKNALSVIGPQIVMPGLFAAEFAKRFFHGLLHDDPPPRIAELIRDLVREFLDEHRNPLGLVYSVYRGIDCYVGP